MCFSVPPATSRGNPDDGQWPPDLSWHSNGSVLTLFVGDRFGEYLGMRVEQDARSATTPNTSLERTRER
jgi:hypothetical protein